MLALDALCASELLRIDLTKGGVVAHAGAVQRGYRPGTGTEPFGFRDGVAQPAIAGLDDEGMPTGEFILGYTNHYDVIPPSPAVRAALDPSHILPSLDNPYHGSERRRDLGRHGSFVVYRKLQQDVAGFWRALRDESVRQRGAADAGYMIWLASKMVGRWPSGAPLVDAPERDQASLGDRDAFEFGADPDGRACPIGAHVRRTNPRDDLKPYPAEQSRHMAAAHRLLRRARVFGPPLFDADVLTAATPGDRDAILSIADDGQRARHPLLLHQRQHPQPVRVRPADLVQQPELRRAVGQQGSDRWRSCARRRYADTNGDPNRRWHDANRSAAALRHGSRRGISVHAEHHRTAFSLGRLIRARLDRLNS